MCHHWKSPEQRKAAMARIRRQYYGYKVTPVHNLKDFAGMNHYAAKQLGFRPLPGKKEIFVDEKLTGIDRMRTIKHEAVEADLMRKHGMTYFSAHKKALVAERSVT